VLTVFLALAAIALLGSLLRYLMPDLDPVHPQPVVTRRS
jgi:hypothetical protein